MSQSASQAAIFYRDIIASEKVWMIKDSGGFPAPKNRDGIRTMPFWSSKSRAELIIKSVLAYNQFKPVELSLIDFYKNWLPGLKKDGMLAGINWSGKKAVGYDVKPENLLTWLNEALP